MAAMAALGIPSGSVLFARTRRSGCKEQVPANSCERVRMAASTCHVGRFPKEVICVPNESRMVPLLSVEPSWRGGCLTEELAARLVGRQPL